LRWFAGASHRCTLSDASLRSFLPLYRDYLHFCPACWSLQRHRLVALFLARHRELTQRGTLRLLHIAPEASLTRLFKAIPGVAYLSADRFNPAAMVRMDI
jgi:hypothetical protein